MEGSKRRVNVRPPNRGKITSVLYKIAYYQNRSDEVPNQNLAADLARTKNAKGIAEIAENLGNANPNIRADCLKVLYEIGYINPKLISSHAEKFVTLLSARNNRLVWGAMIGLSTIAREQSVVIAAHIDEIIETMAKGSVITVDNGIKTLAVVASKQAETRQKLLHFLIDHLKTCRSKEVPQHAESILVAIDANWKSQFVAVLESRQSEYIPSQAKRIKKVIREAQTL